jgi:hypothetical protein
VADGARCYLAHQQERVVGSLLAEFPDLLAAHSLGAVDGREAVTPVVIAPIVAMSQGKAVIDERHAAKQPDWTYDATDSGTVPAERLG